MPRIQADTIEEHVELRQKRIVTAALRLFRKHGLRGVDMSDVAVAAGLKRSSLYRYYANIDELFATCLEAEIRPVVDELRVAMSQAEPGWPRLHAWIEFQMDFATGPRHATLGLMSDVQAASPRVRALVADLHTLARESLADAIAGTGSHAPSDLPILTALVSGMTQSAAMLAIREGGETRIRRELLAAARRVIDAPRATRRRSIQ